MAKKKAELVPYTISAQPAMSKLRRQAKELAILKPYTTGEDSKEVTALIGALKNCIKVLSDNCPNGLATSVVIKKSDLKKILDL
jgi:hypothetical protein